MMRYGRIVGIIVGILALCMVILFGWPAQVKAETAGMTVTAVKEKEKQEPSSEESEEQEDTPDDDEDDESEDIPEDEEDDKTEDESEEKEDDEPEDEPGDKEDDEDDDMPESKEDDRPDDKPEDEDENRPGDTPENEEEDAAADERIEMLEEGDGKQREKSYERIVKMIAIMIGLIGAGIIGAVSGLWDYLWGLFLWYLFRKRKAVWHGILTEEENRYIQIVPASKDFCLAQEIIDYSFDPMEAYGMLEETGDVTYLPKFCKVWVSFQMDGETQIQRLRCDERQVYEFMENLGDVGDKRVLIKSRAARIEIRLVYP